MKKPSVNQILAENIVRQFGSSGTLLGHWLLVDAIAEHLDGHSVREAVRRAACTRGTSVRLAYSRIRGVICYMEKAQAMCYVEHWGGEKKPSPSDLIEKIANSARK